MAASISAGTVSSPCVRPSVFRACGQKVPRANAFICRASKREDCGKRPILSTVLAGAFFGALCFADVGAALAADQGDIYERLGIERPSQGSSGVVLKSKEKKTVFQSRKEAPPPAEAPAPAPAPIPTPDPAPPPAPAPVVESTTKPAPKKKVSKSKAKAAEKTAESKDSVLINGDQSANKAPAESSVKSSPQPPPTVSGKTAAAAAAAGAAAGAAASAAGAAAGAGAAGISLPSIELPSFQSPSLSAPSVSVGGGAGDTLQAAIVAGVEVVLLVIVNSIVDGLFTKKSRKA